MTEYKTKRKNEDMVPGLGVGDIIGAIFTPIGWVMMMSAQLAMMAIRGTGRLMLNMMKLGWRMTVYTILAPFRLLRYLIVGRVPQFETQAQEEAFWRIKRGYRRRFWYGAHRAMFVLGLIVVLSGQFVPFRFYSVSDLLERAIPAFMLWLVILLGHRYFVNMADSEDRDIAAIFEPDHKPKRESDARDVEPARQRLADHYGVTFYDYDDEELVPARKLKR